MIRFLATALGSAIVMALWLAVREERERQAQPTGVSVQLDGKAISRALLKDQWFTRPVTEHDGNNWTWTQSAATNTGGTYNPI